jgi:hypothetical protein
LSAFKAVSADALVECSVPITFMRLFSDRNRSAENATTTAVVKRSSFMA